jgi:phosphate:Na+ symporter
MGVAILLPLIGPFSRVIERIVPDRGSGFARYLDPAALAASPIVAIEAARRTVAHVLAALCSSATSPGYGTLVRRASEALHQVQAFLSKVTEPLPSEDERQWFIETLHALDHTTRLADAMRENTKVDVLIDGPDGQLAVKLYMDAMRSAADSSALLEHVTVQHEMAASTDTKPVASIDLAYSLRSAWRRDVRFSSIDLRVLQLHAVSSSEFSAALFP